VRDALAKNTHPRVCWRHRRPAHRQELRRFVCTHPPFAPLPPPLLFVSCVRLRSIRSAGCINRYNLAVDKNETTNLAGRPEHASLLAMLKQRLVEAGETGPPLASAFVVRHKTACNPS
jgi:hypothetical protein